MSYKYKGKVLNNLHSYYITNHPDVFLNPTDISDNPLRVGDVVLYIPNIKYATPAYVELIEIVPDGTQDKYLGFKMRNGQYSVTHGHTLLKITNDFKTLHPKL